GYGRKELLRQLNFSENTQEQADWALLKAGAGNPIGNLRIKEAYEWLQGQFPVQQNHGFSLDQVVRIAQESIASLGGKAGFGVRMTHNQICSLLMQCCTEPKQEIFEYLKRDLANVA
ncbi:hypothetical protein, partial [Klebsiella pneumoniae]|uniref:hypothetical protein n=1 Tax=Klebsiella pneumoniae TaxID=573 RepID=UPI001C4E1C90